MICDYCKRPMNYCFYINDAHWIKVVGEDRLDRNVGRVCAHCTLERLGGLDWYIIWNEPTTLAPIVEALNACGHGKEEGSIFPG